MITVDEIKKIINEDRVSAKKTHAIKGVKYYEAEHDIKQYKIFYIDDNGKLQEDKTKANERISHPFFTELVDQCTQYVLSGDTDYVRSDIPELHTLLCDYFDDNFKMELNDLLTYASVEGFSYLYRYIDESFKSRFKFADGLNVIEVPKKYTSDNNDYVIYMYFWKTEKNKKIYKIEVWNAREVYYYEMVNDVITLDNTVVLNPRPHVLYEQDNELYQDSFNEIPFIRLDNNRKQYSDLKIVKDLIDDYDIMSCGLSNNIQDLSEGFFVVKGFNGHNMDELTTAIRQKKQIGVSDDGDVEVRTIDIPYEARKVKLELDEKNIYRFGMGLDSSKADGSNITNVVIKSRYALLDLKANKKEMMLRRFMKKIIKIVLDEINQEYKTAYTMKDIYMVFDRQVPSNELDNANIELVKANCKQVEINTLLNIATQIDDDTLLKNICEVLELDYQEVKEKAPQKNEDTTEIKQSLEQVNTNEET